MTIRVNQLPDNQLLSQLLEIRTQLDARKQRQNNNGFEVIMHLNQTTATYDHTATIAAYTTQVFQVDFTSTRQSYALADLTVKLYQDSMSNLVYFPDGAGFGEVITRQIATPNPSIWFVKVTNNDSVSHVFYLKYTMQSTDTGDIKAL